MNSASTSSLRAPRRRVRHSRGVMTKAVSFGSVIALLGLVVWFFLQAGTFDHVWTDPVENSEVLPVPEKSDVAAAEFSGFDGSEDPYTINAISASQDADEPSKTFLKDVTGRLKTNKSGEILHMKSDTGVYNSENKMLDLDGNVELVSTDNYIAYLLDAQVNVNTKRLRSDKKVHVIFDEGTIDADAVEMWNNGNTIVFKNGVKMHIDQRPTGGKDNSK